MGRGGGGGGCQTNREGGVPEFWHPVTTHQPPGWETSETDGKRGVRERALFEWVGGGTHTHSLFKSGDGPDRRRTITQVSNRDLGGTGGF